MLRPEADFDMPATRCSDRALATVERSGAFWKRFFDITVSAGLLTILLPLLILIAIGVMFASGRGPIIYSQTRIGQGGTPFRFYKFRSMRSGADAILQELLHNNAHAREQWERFQKLDPDPRITKFGAFLRRASLDELPQLWNVLRGDMSIVGPRPCLVGQMSLYGDSWEYYCAVRPGLTGLWQVSGRNGLTYADRVRLDRLYVQHANWALDLKILVKTIAALGDGK